MSLSKSKLFLAVVLLVSVALSMTKTASALEGARFWKPYQPEQFGGQRRDADGIYASVEGLYWKISRPSSTWVGYTNPDGSGGTRWAYDGNTTFMQSNSMNMNAANPDFTMGTRIEFGNYRGHHGWLISGYGLPSQTVGFSQQNGSIVINDPENLTLYAIYGGSIGFNEIWQKDGTFISLPRSASGGTTLADGIPQVPIRNVGYLWGWFPIHWSDPWIEGRLAPLPINFARADVRNSTSIANVELMYTYRPHPFKWGGMEFLAGARFWNFDDEMNFFGQGYDQSIIYTGTTNNTNNNNTTYNPGDTTSNEGGVLTVMADSTINGQVVNRITGPQIGIKLNRRNKRWTFGGEFRFMAGINCQSQTVSGSLGTSFIDTAQVPQIDSATIQEHGVLPYLPVGLTHATQSFYHHENKTYFSPGVEMRLTAKWQWTDAIGVNIGFNTTFVDNVARGANIIDYSISPDGTLFGIRGGQNESIIVFGLNFGLTARR